MPGQTAAEIASAYELKQKTAHNVLAALLQEHRRLIAVEGTGANDPPRRYRSLAPQFEEFGVEDRDESIPPRLSYLCGKRQGNHFQLLSPATIGGRGEPVAVALPEPGLPGAAWGGVGSGHG